MIYIYSKEWYNFRHYINRPLYQHLPWLHRPRFHRPVVRSDCRLLHYHPPASRDHSAQEEVTPPSLDLALGSLLLGYRIHYTLHLHRPLVVLVVDSRHVPNHQIEVLVDSVVTVQLQPQTSEGQAKLLVWWVKAFGMLLVEIVPVLDVLHLLVVSTRPAHASEVTSKLLVSVQVSFQA
jgi:hypothetical protein